MNLAKVREKAKELGIKPGKMNKAQIIHAIQVQEKNFPCFGTANGYCDQYECLWRSDCVKPFESAAYSPVTPPAKGKKLKK